MEYSVVISSPEVTELIVATVSKEFYAYWKDKTLEEKVAACEDSDDELDIPEEFRLSNWHSMNNVIHINAPDYSESNIVVEDYRGDEVCSKWLGSDFELLQAGPDNADFKIADLPEGSYVMKLHREADGDYYTGVLDVEDFDVDKLRLVVQEIENAGEYSEPGESTQYLIGLEYWDGDNHIAIENTDETYQGINGFTRIDFISRDAYVAWATSCKEE